MQGAFVQRQVLDEVNYDVRNMDTCRLLFRIPWQFDVETMHFGRGNTYQIKKGGIKFTLFPMNIRLKPKVASIEAKPLIIYYGRFKTRC